MPSSKRPNKSEQFMTRHAISAWRVSVFLILALMAVLATYTIVRAAVDIAPTKTDFIINDDGDGKADPGETIEYTVVIPNNGPTDATGVTFNDIIDLNTTFVDGSLNVSPLAGDDSYQTIGNTMLAVGVTPSTDTPAVIVINPATDSLFDNDTEFLGDTFTLKSVEADTTAPFTTATEQGGSVTVETDGNFSYTPPAGFSGADHFDYMLTDDELTGAGRVTINVTTERVWYVKNNAAPGGLGRSNDPFDTLLEAQTASSVNDTIYVFTGSGTTGQNTGIILKNGQRLLGEGVDLTVPVSVNGGPNPTNLRTAGTRPTIGNTTGDGVMVSTVSIGGSFSGVEIRGLDISVSGAGTNAVDVTTNSTFSGSFELADNVIGAAGVEGVDVNGGGSGTLTISLHDNTVTATGNGIDIVRSTAVGSVYIIAFDDNVVTGATGGIGINVTGSGWPVQFDSNTGTAAYDTVSGGTMVIGSSGAGNGVGNNGMVLSPIRGDLSFTDLDIYSDNGAALTITGTSSDFLASGTGTRLTVNTGTPSLVAVNGPALSTNLTNINIVPSTFSSTNSTSTGVSLIETSGTFTAPTGSSITNATGVDFFVNGNSISAATVSVTYPGTITDTSGRLVYIQNVTGASPTYAFSGAISGSGSTSTGVLLDNNDGATIRFSGGLALSTGSNTAFSAINGAAAVEVCDENPCNPAATGALVNTLTSTTGTALNVANSTIGVNNLEFKSIAANGAANGILLNVTGSTGGLVVKGDSGSSNNSSGGTIQSSTGDGISLTSTRNVSLDQMNIQSTGGSGINGTGVTNFAFTNGTIANAGNASFKSAIGFNGGAVSPGFGNNINGTLTVTGNTFTNPFYSAVEIQSDNGTVTVADISNNTITNPGFGGINLVGIGNVTTSFNLNRATINQNNITSAGGTGIQVSIGNSNTYGPGATAGSLATGSDIISITNNSISIDPTGANAIIVANSGGNNASRTKTNFLIQCNGKNSGGCSAPTANPITGSSIGTDILIGNNGYATMVGTVDNNSIDANHTVGGGAGNGIGGGNGVAGAGNAWTPDLTLTVTNNTITDTDGNGILLVGRGTSGIARYGIRNNTVAAPLSGVRPGIRVDAGNASSADDSICLDISGNTTAGSGGHEGIGLRKQGTSSTVNDFGIEGMSATTTPGIETYVGNTGLNPGSASGSFGVSGVLLISATSGFSNCSTTAMAPDNNQTLAQVQSEPNPVVLAESAPVSEIDKSVNATTSVNQILQAGLMDREE